MGVGQAIIERPVDGTVDLGSPRELGQAQLLLGRHGPKHGATVEALQIQVLRHQG